MDGAPLSPPQDRGVKEDELQSILNYLLTMHEVKEHVQTQKGEGGNHPNGPETAWRIALQWRRGHSVPHRRATAATLPLKRHLLLRSLHHCHLPNLLSLSLSPPLSLFLSLHIVCTDLTAPPLRHRTRIFMMCCSCWWRSCPSTRRPWSPRSTRGTGSGGWWRRLTHIRAHTQLGDT